MISPSRARLPSLAAAFAAAACLLGAAQAAPSAQGPREQALRASEVIGGSVRNPRGQDIGRVDDMVVNARTGQVRYAVLHFDAGFLQQDRLYAVPTEKLHSGRDGKLVLDAPTQQLERSAIEPSGWGRDYLANPRGIAQLDRTWELAARDASDGLVRASDVLGGELRSTHTGEKVGKVQDLVIDPAQHRVSYAVVDFDGAWLGTGKRAAMEFEALRSVRGAGHLVADVDRARAMGLRSVAGGK